MSFLEFGGHTPAAVYPLSPIQFHIAPAIYLCTVVVYCIWIVVVGGRLPPAAQNLSGGASQMFPPPPAFTLPDTRYVSLDQNLYLFHVLRPCCLCGASVRVTSRFARSLFNFFSVSFFYSIAFYSTDVSNNILSRFPHPMPPTCV
jgi:hypothetical protein